MSQNLVWCQTSHIMQIARRTVTMEVPDKQLAIEYLSLTLEKLGDKDLYQFDYVVDAGISNIIAFSNTVTIDHVDHTYYNPGSLKWDTTTEANLVYWHKVCSLFTDYCKGRQDCLALLDSPRILTLDGNAKKVRRTNQEATFYSSISKNFRKLPIINSQFGVMFFNWWKAVEIEMTRDEWLPPSILAGEIYCSIPFWNAPAGLNYGVVPNVRDISVNPSKQQASLIYDNKMNYFVIERGQCRLEGQKTLYAKSSAFDRVNVRRLFNFMNRSCDRLLRYFVYETNTLDNRRRLTNYMNVLFNRLLSLQAIYDFRVVCDETINTPDTIDRNELHVIVLVKPAKTIEFMKISFVATRTADNFADVYANLDMTGAMNW